MPYVISVTNLKGGCGKSCIAVNLACELAAKRATSVTLVDADAQATATYHCSAGLLPIAHHHLPLDDPRQIDSWIRRVLALETDYVILDAPPHVGAVTRAIVGISDAALVPCTASTADLLATVSAVDLIRAARQARSDGGPKCLLVPSRIDRRTSNGRDIESALEKFGETVGPAIHQRTAFVDAFTAQRSIRDYAPNSDAHRDIEALTSKVRSLTHERSKKKR